MKRFVSLFVVLCVCFSLCACGSTTAASAATATPAATAATANAGAEPTTTPEPTPEPADLQPLVDSLNEAEIASRKEDAPSIGVYAVGSEALTIDYKLAMHIFQYVIMMAMEGDMEALDSYNRLVESLPGLEDTLENALHESVPDLRVRVILMEGEYSDVVATVVEDGEIVYDLVNGVGVAPKGITSILEAQELSPELRAKLEESNISIPGITN